MIKKQYEMIPLTYDFMFKAVFIKHPDILIRFLKSVLHLPYSLQDCKIKFLNSELPKDNYREKKNVLDIIVNINDIIYVDIEVNTENFRRVSLRNKKYLSKLSTYVIEEGKRYSEIDKLKLIQLNLNEYESDDALGSHKIVSYDLDAQIVIDYNETIYLKNLAFYHNLYYTKPINELEKHDIWLASLSSKSYDELDEILSYVLEDDDRSIFIEEVKTMSKDEFTLHGWQYEKFAKNIEWQKEVERKEGQKQLKEIKKQLKKAEKELKDKKNQIKDKENQIKDKENQIKDKENQIKDKENQIKDREFNTIKEMYNNGLDLELISKIMKLSVEDINNIINN